MFTYTKKITHKALNNIIYIFFVITIILFTALETSFLSFENLKTIIIRASIIGPVAFGIMLAIILGGIDLSGGCVLGIVGLVIALSIKAGIPTVPAILLGLLTGALIGAINGTLIAFFKMNPFITTLSIMFIGSSIEKVLTQGGLPIYMYGNEMPDLLEAVYRGKFLGIESAIWIFLAVIILYYLFLEKSYFGRQLYASGLSLKGARVVGINIENFYFSAYMISGFSAAVAGIIVMSNVRSAQPHVGMSYLWDGLGAAFLSTLVSKTMRPNIAGAIFGVIFLSVVANGLTYLGMNFYWKEFFKGVFILVILLASVIKRKALKY